MGEYLSWNIHVGTVCVSHGAEWSRRGTGEVKGMLLELTTACNFPVS